MFFVFMKINVKVKPNSIENKVVKLGDGSYVVFVKERAIEGKANLSVRKLLAKEFGVSSVDVLIKTPKSHDKIIEIIGK